MKLSQMKVAQFPWDPKPELQSTTTAAGLVAAQAAPSGAVAVPSYTQSNLTPQGAAQTLSLPGALIPNSNGMALKQEPGLVSAEPAIKQEPGLPPMPAIHPGYNPANAVQGTAAQRAAQALQSQYGQRAAASINAIHSGMASQMNAGAQPQQIPRPGQAPQHLNAQQQQQYRQGVAAQIQQRMQQIPHAGAPNGLPAAQIDGSSDVVASSSHSVTMSRSEVDEHLHAQIAARAKQMEGGGLMLPLKDATKDRSLSTTRPKEGGPAQFDGPDDSVKSEEEDEDAINSDLDDSDDDKDDEEDDDETMGHMMLCMYDKVQRVKNKWSVPCRLPPSQTQPLC